MAFTSKNATVLPVLSFPSEKQSDETELPLKKIPGSYGLPFIGAIKDRLDYFYNQGRDEFFKSKIKQYNSTVIRTNMPPGPFISSNPKVIALLDGKSFPILFDVSKVEKKDLFTGTYMPSTNLTGGYRILSYLDPSEPKHAKIKQLLFFLLSSSKTRVFPEFEACYGDLFDTLANEVAAKGKATFGDGNEQAAFNFLGRAFYGSNPPDTKLGTDGPGCIAKWVLFNLAPVLSLGLPKYIEDLLMHTFKLPSFLIKKDYNKLYDFIKDSSGSVQDEAEKLGIPREEAVHNLLFTTCFNTYGGMKILFPSLVQFIGQAGEKLHTKLAQEIRQVIKSNGGELSMAALEEMALMKSVVYETLRIEPPVPAQYARAKQDLMIESHDAVFEVKKGEMMFGYQPFATKDPKIFENADVFVADRFMGKDSEELLKHVFWSNGPETENPTVDNKQCAGKNFVVLMSRLFVVELFRRYDTFEIEVGTSSLGAAITITSVTKASF